ncbi:MAG: D-mannonate epimerase, partial [Spirochaetaceae bacterium]|nr:D-mannonate epimerase [Spirochaetaceae bacterium]
MVYYERGSATDSLSDNELREGLYKALDALGRRRRVLALPPDFTRYHSRAGLLTEYSWEYYHDA